MEFGILRVAQGTGRLPLVVFLGGSGGLAANIEVWDRYLLGQGVSTFAIDSFAGRGIVSTVADQAQLGRLNTILDLYRALEVLAAARAGRRATHAQEKGRPCGRPFLFLG